MSIKSTIKYYLMKILSSVQNFIWPMIVFFAPIKGILITIAVFILLDTFTGIWKSKKKNIPITSRKLSSIVSKLVLYEAAIIGMYLVDINLLGSLTEKIFSIENLITKTTGLVLVYIEGKSINENYIAVRGIDLWQEFKNLLKRSKEIKDDIKDINK